MYKAATLPRNVVSLLWQENAPAAPGAVGGKAHRLAHAPHAAAHCHTTSAEPLKHRAIAQAPQTLEHNEGASVPATKSLAGDGEPQ